MKPIALFAVLLALAAPAGTAGAQEQTAQAACPGPYRVQTQDGRCVWSCAGGTRPDPASGTCICQAGYTPTGVLSRGRLVCARSGQPAPSPPQAAPRPLPQQIPPPPLAAPQISPAPIQPPGGPIAAPPPRPAIPDQALKLASSIALPAKWTRLEGRKMNLFAVLLDQHGAAQANEALTFQISARGGGNRPLHTCRTRTDAHGRGFCLVAIPERSLDDYDVRVSFDGSARLQAAAGATRILGENRGGFEAEIAGGGVKLEAEPIMGGFVPRTPLRARLSRLGSPLAGETVEIAANGVVLGSARTDEAGIAKLHWRSDAQALRNFGALTEAPSNRMLGYAGALEFWHLPAPGSAGGPSVRTVMGDFRLTDPGPLCRLIDDSGGLREGYPHKCSAADAAQRSLTILREAGMTLRQNGFGQAAQIAEGYYRIELPQPADPPPNPDCDARVVNVPDACRTTCSRLEYLTFAPLGDLRALRGPPGGGNARCGWALEQTVEPSQFAINEAHDACALAAQRQGLAQWNHSVAVTMPVRVAAAFGFRDPHTRGERGNWEYKLFLQHKLLSAGFDMTVRVNCR